ncbi:methyl-accepting chemotaxis protein [Alkalihalobacterium bogoriense]|uniref:methyl-accepting chemotaxis protein n=1 Tax=Alkalihalobacterium bogoriense TaxID=246272 RepID=UPI00047CA72D|nr:methyl-accepting chemotaxis protein [Alkalihalobacterium bogoriense]
MIFKPVVSILNKLSYAKKFALIFLVVFIPIVILSIITTTNLQAELAFTKKEKEGLMLLEAVYPLIQSTQQHRGLTVTYLSGDKTVENQVITKQQEVNEHIQTVGYLLGEAKHDYTTKESWKNIMEDWNHIESDVFNYTVSESIQSHNELIALMIEEIGLIADESNLRLDSDLENNYSIFLLVQNLPQITEFMGTARAVGSRVITNKEMTHEEEIQLVYLTRLLDTYLSDTTKSYDAIFTYNPQLQAQLSVASEQAIAKALQITNIIDREIIETETITISQQEYFQLTTETINSVFDLILLQENVLAASLDQKITSLVMIRNITLSIVLFVSIFMIYLFIGFYRSVQENVQKIEEITGKIANFDLREEVSLTSNDEMQKIAISINKMLHSFRHIVVNSQSLSQEVGASSQQLVATIEEATEATGQISSSVEEVASVVEQQLKSSNENVDSTVDVDKGIVAITSRANKVSDSSKYANEQAELGEKNIQKAIQQMKTIDEAVVQTTTIIKDLGERSNHIGTMIHAITGIADQTNLLALNAAIEAARAGEHGKGFAVVASEVRTLAEQSSHAAKQIQVLLSAIKNDTAQTMEAMEHVNQEAKEGVEIAVNTEKTFLTILEATKQVGKEISEVTGVSSSIMDKMKKLRVSIEDTATKTKVTEGNTQTVAASTEQQLASMQEITSSANELSARAEQLQNLVEQYKV